VEVYDMPVVSIDQDLFNEIMRVRRLIKGSVDGVMDGTLTAGHLASDVQILLDLLDSIQPPPAIAPAPAPAPAAEQPAQPAPQPEQPPSVQADQEVPVTVEEPAPSQQ
jgi:hypothetical protein